MQKKYILILFGFFMSNNVVAQLSEDLVHFTQTLKNVAAKLPAGVVLIPPGGVELLPSDFIISGGIHVEVPSNGKIEIFEKGYFMTVPLDSHVTKYPDEKIFDIGLPFGGSVRLANNEKITAPAGSTIRSTNLGPVVFVASSGGDVTIPPGTSIFTLVDSTAQYSKGMREMPALKEQIFSGGGIIKIIPKGSIPPPAVTPSGPTLPSGGISVLVPPAGGDVKLSDAKIVNVPPGSKIRSTDKGLVVTLPMAGGNVTLPPLGGYIRVSVDSKVILPSELFPEHLTAGEYIKVDKGGIVKITSDNMLPLPLNMPMEFVDVQVPPGGGDVKLPGGNTINVPSGTIIESYSSIIGIKVTYIKLVSDGIVTLSSDKKIEAPPGSIIRIEELRGELENPQITIPTKDGIVRVPAGGLLIVSSDSTLLFSGTTMKLLAGVGHRFTSEETITVNPIK